MNKIVKATTKDIDEIYQLYKAQIGREFCPWDEHYPGIEYIEFDLKRDSLFVMKNDNDKIIASISIDQDESVDELPNWNPDLAPAGEVARIAVLPEYQNQGIAKQMINYLIDYLKNNGYKSIHLLVNIHNKKALNSYRHLKFKNVGQCYLYEQDYYCYEREL